MSAYRALDRLALLNALNAIGIAAVAQNTRLELAIYGGSALMLASNFRFSTEHVDIAELGAWPAWLEETVAAIGTRNGWTPDWLNEAIKNATSILDYVFRELAISYLGRNELAHVDPSEIGPDVIGGGESQGKAVSHAEVPASTAKFVSKGFVRSKADKLMLVQGGMMHGPYAPSGFPPTGLATAGATALKGDVDAEMATIAQALDIEMRAPHVAAVSSAAEKRSLARMKGYTGESCTECGNFTLVRNGTCLKCDTCGGTSGCS